MKNQLLKKIVLPIFSILFLSTNAQNQSNDYKLNEPNSMNIEIKLFNEHNHVEGLHNIQQFIDTNLSQQLQNVLNEAVINYNIKGISAALMNSNNEIWEGAAGLSHDTITVKPDMLMGIGSITKNFIATIILQLYEEGLLDLSDSLHNWLPTFQNIDTTVTIRQLLNHTSGIYNYLMYPWIEDTVQAHDPKIWTPEEILETFVLEAYFPPGTDWEYSNTNYILLGLIIEEVTGHPILAEFHDRVTIPLNLNSTFLYPDEDYVGVRSHCWIPLYDTLIDITDIENASWYSVYWTAGAILSTPEQIVRWQKELYEGDLLNDTTIDLMVQPAPYSGGAYGLGTQIGILYSEDVYGHTGDVVYYSSLFYVPSESLSIAVISNTRFAPINDIWLDLYTAYTTATGTQDYLITELEIVPRPNPFTTYTGLSYKLSHPEKISLMIYNQMGQIVFQTEEIQQQGNQQLIWNAEQYAGGVYFYRLKVGNVIANGKLVKVR
jgi:D-alanyl-D-alanine carboxypeptidase